MNDHGSDGGGGDGGDGGEGGATMGMRMTMRMIDEDD